MVRGGGLRIYRTLPFLEGPPHKEELLPYQLLQGGSHLTQMPPGWEQEAAGEIPETGPYPHTSS